MESELPIRIVLVDPPTGIDFGRPGHVLSASVPGTGRDGGPSCATVKPLGASACSRV
jgi:hypothetical protein